MRNRRGFNLFELLIAMLLFSALLAFAIPTIRYYQRETLRATINGDLRILQAALKTYFPVHQHYPDPVGYQSLLSQADPAIIDRPLLDPFSDQGKTPYIYLLSPNKQYYVAYSVGLLGDTRAYIADTGKITFVKGNPAVEQWISNGRL